MKRYNKVLVGALTGVMSVTTVSGTAMASRQYTGDKVTSIWSWRTGTTQRHQGHAGDDIGFRKTSGTNPSIDMRWAKCTNLGVHGSPKYNINNRSGRRTIGANFKRGTCFKLQYRGFTKKSGTFKGYVYWNYNFA